MWTSGAQGLGEAQLDIRVCAPWLLSRRADIHVCAPSLLRRRVDIHLWWCPRPDIGLRRTRAGRGRCASPSIGRLLKKSHWAQIRALATWGGHRHASSSKAMGRRSEYRTALPSPSLTRGNEEFLHRMRWSTEPSHLTHPTRSTNPTRPPHPANTTNKTKTDQLKTNSGRPTPARTSKPRTKHLATPERTAPAC